MTDLGLMKYFLGLEVTQTGKGIFIFQHKYAIDILQRFRMDKCKPTETPIALGTKLTKNDDGSLVNATLYKQMLGSLMHLTATRPDLMYVVSVIFVDVFVTLECIHLCILCIVTRCLFWDVYIM